MKKYAELGSTLKNYRLRSNLSTEEVVRLLKVDRSYLSKLENGHEKPSSEILNKLSKIYSLLNVETLFVKNLILKSLQIEKKTREEVISVEKNIPVNSGQNPKEVQISVPANTPVLYCDSILITSSKFGVVFDFAQSMGSSNQQTVVARVGVSKEHAQAFLKSLKENLEESSKTKVLQRVEA